MEAVLKAAVKPKSGRKAWTPGALRKIIDKLRETQIRPDMNGDIRFMVKPGQFWEPYDERHSWLGGVKPVGG